MSFDRLIANIIEKRNPTVVGLDPKLDFIPKFILDEAVESNSDVESAAADAIYRFNCGLIDALWDIVPAVKPQAAYYEMYGWQGVRALKKTIEYAAGKGMFVIIDGKRNDIGSTMQAYAVAHLGEVTAFGKTYEPFGGDALTVNGYLGTDGIKPLLEICQKRGRGIFVLAKTSNPSSGELQDRILDDGKTIYQTMAAMCESWGQGYIGEYGYSAVGAVVGATYPKELSLLREACPHTMFLVPGYGAQGGKAEDIIGAFDKRGLGAIVNSSRAIMQAYIKEGCDERDFAGAARREALRMKKELEIVF